MFLAAVSGAVFALVLMWLHGSLLDNWLDEQPVPRADVHARGYAQAVARAAPSVVSIYSTRPARPKFCEEAAYRDWCSTLERRGAQGSESALGSGVMLRADGYIVTNDHVIAGADEVLVGLADGTLSRATVIGRDPETDLAALHIGTGPLQPITVAASSRVRVGDIVLAIGNPFGIGQTVSQGIVSATGRTSITASPWGDFMQTDAAINPGNSGGALINTQGELVGINTRILSRSLDAEGIGFAIPSDLAMSVLESLIRDGRVRRGWLGIELAEENPDESRRPVLVIIAVEPDGPAGKAGIKTGDHLLAIDDQMPIDTAHLGRMVASSAPGTRMRLTIERDRSISSVDATVEERPPG